MPDQPAQPAPSVRADPMPTPPMHPAQIGPYRITGILGRGGMGVVYRATVVVSCEVPMGQEVAIKLLRDTDASERVRFAREAGYLQKLRHPNIVRVYDAGEYAGQPYIVMQLLHGRHVDALVANGRQLDQRHAAEIAVQCLDALVAAHRQGILHRDIKPGNLILSDDGVVRLLDFGLAQLMVLESNLTASGAVVGTPAYMSPEQARGDRDLVSPRSDVYGLGACLYELLTGHPPFEADNPVAVLHRVVNTRLTPARTWRPDLNQDLEIILVRAMAKDPQDRYPSASAMAEDLRCFLRGERIATRRPNPFIHLVRLVWEQRRAAASIGLGLFVSLALVALLIDIAITRRPASAVPAEQVSPVANPLAQPENAWITAWERAAPIVGSPPMLKIRKFPEKKSDLDYIELPDVTGPLRLSASVTFGDARSRVELLINDQDIGAGYRVSLAAGEQQGQLALVRDRRILLSRTIPALPLHTPLTLTIERHEDDRITATYADMDELELTDLVPIEDIVGSGVSIAFSAQTVVQQVKLERRRSPGVTSPLALADAKRLAKGFAKARRDYEKFIEDFPTSPLVRDARLRLAMCDRELDNAEAALESCLNLVSEWRDETFFMQQATFQAWLCALALKRYQEAEEFLLALEQDFDINYLLTISDGSRIRDLLVDLLKRSEEFAQQGQPDRAVNAFGLAEDVARFLNRKDDLRRIRHWRGDLLRALDHRASEALAVFQRIVNEPGETDLEHAWGRIKVAETLRLMGRNQESADAWRIIIAQGTALPESLIQIAKLWLGETLLEMGDLEQAKLVWRTSSESVTIPGRAMSSLVAKTTIPAATTRSAYDNDVPYLNARLSAMQGDKAAIRSWLEKSLEKGPPWNWPAPLASQWLKRLEAPPSLEPR